MDEEKNGGIFSKLFWGYLAYKIITKPFKHEEQVDEFWEEE